MVDPRAAVTLSVFFFPGDYDEFDLSSIVVCLNGCLNGVEVLVVLCVDGF